MFKLVCCAAVYRPKDLESENVAGDGVSREPDAPRPDSVELAKADNKSQAKTV